MDPRACARLGALCAAAAGVVGLTLHLDDSDAGSHAGPGTSTVTALSPGVTTTLHAAPAGTRSDTQSRLQSTLARTGTNGGPAPAVPATDEPVDESRPHSHVVDPETGGLISVAGATGTVPNAANLGPMHADPMPTGLSLTDPTDTRTLLRRASLAPRGLEDDDHPLAAGATAPVGAPGIKTLTKHVVPSCSGSGTNGNRVQVLYVHEVDTPSRYSQVLPILRNEVANVDDVFALSAQQTGGERRVRWVHGADCLPVVKDVTVPDGALGSDFWDTVDAVKDLGYEAPNRKYLMFADANRFCGIGTVYADRQLSSNANDGSYASFSRVDANCWSSGHSVAAHELTHNLGGVLGAAPHATANGHCYDESDLMCYDDGSGVAMQKVCASAQEQLLDCNHDDYFNTSPGQGTFLANNWNTARSSFLDAVVVPASAPVVTVKGSTTAARTGDRVTFTATSARTVSWAWSRSSTGAACTLTPGTPGQATLVCPSTVSGTVTVSAKGTEIGTGASGAGTASVSVTKATLPSADVTAPTAASAGDAFPVSVAATGKVAFSYAWRAGACTIGSPTLASTTVTCPEGTPTQKLVVSALVTQADGQRVRHAATVQLAGTKGVVPAATPGQTSWNPPVVDSGTASALLRDTTGTALAGRPVSLQAKWAGTSTWQTVRSLATDSSGRAVATPVYSRAGSFRFVALGDPSYGGSASGSAFLKAPMRATASVPSRFHAVATLQTVAGTRVTGATMLLQRWSAATSQWVSVAESRTDARGVVDREVRPPQATYFRWVFRGDGARLSAYSARLTLR